MHRLKIRRRWPAQALAWAAVAATVFLGAAAPGSAATRQATAPDTTPPTVTIDPGDGAVFNEGWTASVIIRCHDEPGGSGIASCTGTQPIDVWTEADTTPGQHVITAHAVD